MKTAKNAKIAVLTAVLDFELAMKPSRQFHNSAADFLNFPVKIYSTYLFICTYSVAIPGTEGVSLQYNKETTDLYSASSRTSL